MVGARTLTTSAGAGSADRWKKNFKKVVPEGDSKERAVCQECGFINYHNPKIVAGVVALSSTGKVLLCKRAIEPKTGYWTLPAGYMEVGETVQAGAAREAREEANATVEAGSLLTMYDVPRIGQVHMYYRAKLLSDEVSAGEETLDVALVDLDEIPWDQLAFPTVRHTLEFFLKTGRHSADAIDFKSITEQLI